MPVSVVEPEVPVTVISPVPRADNQPAATSQLTIHVNSSADNQPSAASPPGSDLVANLRKVGGTVSTPLLMYSVEPKFSEDARKANLSKHLR